MMMRECGFEPLTSQEKWDMLTTVPHVTLFIYCQLNTYEYTNSSKNNYTHT